MKSNKKGMTKMERKVNMDNYSYNQFLEFKNEWKWYILEIGRCTERFGNFYKIFIVKDNELKDITYYINHHFYEDENQLFLFYGHDIKIEAVIMTLKRDLELAQDIEVL